LFKNYRSSPNFGLPCFIYGKNFALILTKKMGWAAFWAISSQIHLVTLLEAVCPSKHEKNAET
jgi:hypothetical protein